MILLKLAFYNRDVHDDWGLFPKSGPNNLSGEWNGVMGGVVNKEYDLSISAWYIVMGREDILQFSPIAKTRFVNILAPKRRALDFGLFTRAITNESWIGIISMVLIFGLTSLYILAFP